MGILFEELRIVGELASSPWRVSSHILEDNTPGIFQGVLLDSNNNTVELNAPTQLEATGPQRTSLYNEVNLN